MIAFGPVPSRRLGKSLGINNINARKVCSYACVYCQLGKTSKKSAVRKIFYEPKVLVNEIHKHLIRLDKEYKPDYLTFVANGEPTLDANLGKEIQLLKKFFIPIAVITNASLIHHTHVQDDLMEADWVSVKIDTINESIWRKINRPLDYIDFEKNLFGLQQFKNHYKGILNTETMLVKDLNTSANNITGTASFIASLQPDTAYIAIPTRPPAVAGIKPALEETLNEAYQVFHNTGVKTQLLTGFEGTDSGFTGNATDDILNITAVHPLREDAMAELLEKDKADFSTVESLVRQKMIKSVTYNGNRYYLRKYHN